MKLNTIDKNKTIRIIAAAIIGVLIIVMLFFLAVEGCLYRFELLLSDRDFRAA